MPRAKTEAGIGKPRPATADSPDQAAQTKLLGALKAQLKRLYTVRNSDERKKQFLKLCFQWHPDKNPVNVEVATKGFQILQEEKNKLLSV